MTRVEARSLATDPATGDPSVPLYPGEAVDRLRTRIGTNEADGELIRLQRYAGQLERSMRSTLREFQQLQAIEAKRPTATDRPPAGAAMPAATAATPMQSPVQPSRPTDPRHDPSPHDPPRHVPASQEQDGTAVPPLAPPDDPPPTDPTPAAAASQISDGLRVSGSFGAPATMAMPATAFTPVAPITAEAAATAVSGSFGQKRRQAGKTPPAIPPTNEILPTLGKIAVAAAVQGI